MVSGRTIVGTGGRPVTRWWRALTVMLVLLLGLATAGGASATPGGGKSGKPVDGPAAAAQARTERWISLFMSSPWTAPAWRIVSTCAEI